MVPLLNHKYLHRPLAPFVHLPLPPCIAPALVTLRKTGAKHANKSVGPLRWLQANVPNGVTDEAPFADPDAHGADLPVSIHQGVGAESLEGGVRGVIRHFTRELFSSRIKPTTRLLLVNYDYSALVPAIKVREQQGRSEKVGKCRLTFDPSSTSPIPASQYQSFLRADTKRARDGIAANVAMDALSQETWSGQNPPNGIVAFYGVPSAPDLGRGEGHTERVLHLGPGAGTRDATVGGPEQIPLLHYRNGAATDGGILRHRGPNIGEAELSLVHFMVWAKKYFGQDVKRWIISSIDTDQWMIILLAMSTSKIRPSGPGMVDVAVRKGGRYYSQYIWVNRVYQSICALEDGSESAWPSAGFDGWIPSDDDKVRLFVLVYLLAGCDFLPAISGLPFEKMWELTLKSVRSEGLFPRSMFSQEGDV